MLTVVVLAGLFPWEAEYHQYQERRGVVKEIGKRLLADGDSMSEKFVVRFEGVDGEFGCLDTRCAIVEPGDKLTVKCLMEWDYNGTDGHNCKFVRTEEGS